MRRTFDFTLQVQRARGKATCCRIPLMFAPLKTCVLWWITTERRPNGLSCRNLSSPRGERKTFFLQVNVFLLEQLSHNVSVSWEIQCHLTPVVSTVPVKGRRRRRRRIKKARAGWTRDGSDEFMCFLTVVIRRRCDIHYGMTVLWTNRAGCLRGADWVGRWSLNYDEKASARLTPLHLRLICSQGEILFSLQDRGKKNGRGIILLNPSAGRLRLGVVQHLLLYFPMESSRVLFFFSSSSSSSPKWFLAPCEID